MIGGSSEADFAPRSNLAYQRPTPSKLLEQPERASHTVLAIGRQAPPTTADGFADRLSRRVGSTLSGGLLWNTAGQRFPCPPWCQARRQIEGNPLEEGPSILGASLYTLDMRDHGQPASVTVSQSYSAAVARNYCHCPRARNGSRARRRNRLRRVSRATPKIILDSRNASAESGPPRKASMASSVSSRRAGTAPPVEAGLGAGADALPFPSSAFWPTPADEAKRLPRWARARRSGLPDRCAVVGCAWFGQKRHSRCVTRDCHRHQKLRSLRPWLATRLGDGIYTHPQVEQTLASRLAEAGFPFREILQLTALLPAVSFRRP